MQAVLKICGSSSIEIARKWFDGIDGFDEMVSPAFFL
nr:MAG TPA: hypothetical protein [Caudoviricetes sp.]